jgi:hypothetical protein
MRMLPRNVAVAVIAATAAASAAAAAIAAAIAAAVAAASAPNTTNAKCVMTRLMTCLNYINIFMMSDITVVRDVIIQLVIPLHYVHTLIRVMILHHHHHHHRHHHHHLLLLHHSR